MIDRTISACRSAWYMMTEPAKLRLARMRAGVEYKAERPLVSVYIPTFNRAALLIERGLGSVLAQSHSRLEVIVVAHGCTDDTVARVATLGDPRVRVIEVPRVQAYPATLENHWYAHNVAPANAGLEACNGLWIARNDDDDIWTEDHVAHLLRLAIDGDYELVSGGSQNHKGRIEPYDLDGVKVGGHQTWLYRSYLKSFRYNPDCWRKKWNRVNDTDLQDRFRRAGVRMGYLDRTVTMILPRPGESDVGLAAYRKDARNKLKTLAFNP